MDSKLNMTDIDDKLRNWLRSEGMKLPPLKIASFKSIGRGLMAESPFSPEQTLIHVPHRLIITKDSALVRLQHQNINNLEKYSTHEILALFLINEKFNQGNNSSFWTPYLDSLPTTYDVPYFNPVSHSELLPSYLKSVLEQQRLNVEKSKIFKLYPQHYPWAYFTVNTRAVYYAKGSMALVPFLDMFNHSPEVEIENDENFGYSLINKNMNIEKGDQVFINYGPHDNLKLYIDYGFIVPNNPHDSVPVIIQDLMDFNNESSSSSSLNERLKIISENNFDFKMCFGLDEDGNFSCSWNVYACIFILHFLPSDSLNKWYLLLYENELENNRQINEFVLKLLRVKLKELQNSISNLNSLHQSSSSHPSCSCSIAVQLMTNFQCILSKGIKSLSS